MKRAVVALLLTFCACYGDAQRSPKRPEATELQPGATATLGLHGKKDRIEDGEFKGGYRAYALRYGGTSKTYSEYRAIVDPNWSKTLDRYDQLYKRCIGSKTPRLIGGYTVLAGLLVSIYGVSIKDDDDKRRNVLIGGGSILGLGGVIWGSGYLFFGGRTCSQADDMWRWKSPWLENHGDDGPIARPQIDEELKALTDAFNARMAGSPGSPPNAE